MFYKDYLYLISRILKEVVFVSKCVEFEFKDPETDLMPCLLRRQGIASLHWKFVYLFGALNFLRICA